MSSFDDIFKAVEKKTKEDPLSSQHKAGDLTISSHIPFSILTGVPELDYNIARPGWPAGRVIELFGYEHCIAYDSFIQYSIRTKEGKIQNSKGGTIERLHNRFHNIPIKGKGNYIRQQTVGAEYYAPSINDENRVVQNKILDVVQTGNKECFLITTKLGYTLKVTKDHKFYTGYGYSDLKNLSVGNTIFIHNNTRYKSNKIKYENKYRKYLFVKNHPIAGTKIINSKSSRTSYHYSYKRLSNARAVYEANLNNLSLNEYAQKLNAGDIHNLTFLPREHHIHHIDEDFTNDSFSNLMLFTPSKLHNQHHAIKNHNKLRYVVIPDIIEAIESVGELSTYDLKMQSPFNNYITNNIVTHNCGKTTLAYHAIAEAQRMGGGGYFIDTEKSWDDKRAAQCGVDPDLRFRIMDCDSIEAVFRSILNIVDARSSSNDGKPFIIVVDSVTGTATEFMKAHEMGKEERVGQDARAIRGGMRRIMPKLAKANVNLFMINHAISTIPKFKFAKQSEAAGGHAIKLFSTVRVNLASTGWITIGEKDKRRIGQKVMMKVEKLKGSCMSEPVIKEVALYNTHGFDTLGSLLAAGCKTGWVEHKKGSQDYAISNPTSDENIDFSKANWETVVNDRGGLRAAYHEFIAYCMEQGIMETWGG